jgi:hypothetical protein
MEIVTCSNWEKHTIPYADHVRAKMKQQYMSFVAVRV